MCKCIGLCVCVCMCVCVREENEGQDEYLKLAATRGDRQRGGEETGIHTHTHTYTQARNMKGEFEGSDKCWVGVGVFVCVRRTRKRE
jgi:hypothetical protein